MLKNLIAAAVLAAGAALSSGAPAQEWPTEPLTMLIGYGAAPIIGYALATGLRWSAK